MASIGPKKDGSPNIEFFQSSECLTAFEGIRIWLQKNCKKVRNFLGLRHLGFIQCLVICFVNNLKKKQLF